MNQGIAWSLTALLLAGAIGCDVAPAPQSDADRPRAGEQRTAKMATVVLQIADFQKSKSGATWMAWPNAVKQALDELEAVRDVEMRLDRDQFVVTVDTTKASEEELVAIVKKAGYTANVVTGDVAPRNEVGKTVGSDAPIFVKALARARKENKPVVVDFYAGWCGPCLKMLEVTFPDPKVAALLERCVFLKVDTDEHSELAKSFGVVGLPDIRLLAPDGTEKRRLLDFQDAESFGAELEKLLASADG